MNIVLSAALTLGFGLVLGVCEPALAQGAPGKFDGTYVGMQTRTGGKGCGLGRDVTMPVTNNGFFWGVPPARATIAIAADGTIDGKVGTLNLTGKATATGLDFTTTTPQCANLWHFDKK